MALFLRQRRHLLLAIALCTLVPINLWAAQPGTVAVGDVHGDLDDFVAILQKAGLIDQERRWHGGATVFVQVGDLIDRGPRPREVMDLVMTLEPEAKKAGGRVVSVLGNHEVMNLMGDLRYVTPENYASFAEENSEKHRRSAWQAFSKWRAGHANLMAELPAVQNLTEADWTAQHPLGFLEQREAFSPGGKYGKWVRGRPAIVKIGNVVFLHGGLDPSIAAMGLDTINSRIHEEITTFDTTRQYLVGRGLILPFFTLQEIVAVVQAELRVERAHPVPQPEQLQYQITPFIGLQDWLSVRPNGPLWFRGYDEWSEEEGNSQLPKILQVCGATSIVVGHTVQKEKHIRSRFDGKVFLIDTGMLGSYYPGGKPSALEIRGDGEIAAEYLEQRVVLQSAKVSPPNSAKAGKDAKDMLGGTDLSAVTVVGTKN